MALHIRLGRWLTAFCLVIGLLLVGGLGPRPATAELRIDVTQGRADPMPIAIGDFSASETASAQIGRDMAGVISANLQRSGL